KKDIRNSRFPRSVRPRQHHDVRTITHHSLPITSSEHRPCSISNEGGALWLSESRNLTTLPQRNKPVEFTAPGQNEPVDPRFHIENAVCRIMANDRHDKKNPASLRSQSP